MMKVIPCIVWGIKGRDHYKDCDDSLFCFQDLDEGRFTKDQVPSMIRALQLFHGELLARNGMALEKDF